MKRHPQRRLPSEVATHTPRGGRVQAPERNRGLREGGSEAVSGERCIQWNRLRGQAEEAGSWIHSLLNSEVALPQGLLKVTLTVSGRGVRPGGEVGTASWETVIIIHA